MDTVLQAQFARIDAALGTLVESISTYNPSVQAAVALVAADDDLSEGLDQLSYHQSNHSRILALRAEATALESQLKASITTLSNLRHELLETQTSTIPTDARNVPLNDLLSFARNIASHTVPPSHREPIPTDDPDADKTKLSIEDASTNISSSNGTGTPAIPNLAIDPTSQPAPSTTDVQDDQPQPAPTISDEQAEFIRRMNEPNGWTPWPNTIKVHSGNLMFIQANLLDYEKDPWTGDADPAVEAAKEAEKEQEDREQREREQEEEKRRRVAALAAQQQRELQMREEEGKREDRQFQGFEFDD